MLKDSQVDTLLPTDSFRKRFIYGIILLGLSIVGIPFIPFIPLATLLGCWNITNKTNSPWAIGEAVPSYVTTVGIGLVCYWQLWKYITT